MAFAWLRSLRSKPEEVLEVIFGMQGIMTLMGFDPLRFTYHGYENNPQLANIIKTYVSIRSFAIIVMLMGVCQRRASMLTPTPCIVVYYFEVIFFVLTYIISIYALIAVPSVCTGVEPVSTLGWHLILQVRSVFYVCTARMVHAQSKCARCARAATVGINPPTVGISPRRARG